jgi:hypothetical protein
MLNFFLLKKTQFNFFQSGLYVDFFLKKIGELFTRNVLIYTGIFFCEKFVIEFTTKKCFDSFFFLSKVFFFPNFFFESFFSQIIFILFYLIFFLEFFYILV